MRDAVNQHRCGDSSVMHLNACDCVKHNQATPLKMNALGFGKKQKLAFN